MAAGYPSGLDEATWMAHDRAVNQCRGRFCLYFIAESLDLPPDDVDAIEIRCQAIEWRAEDDIEPNGTIRRWCTDGNKPRQDSINKIKQATDGAVDLAYWIMHPLINLVRREPPSITQLNGYLEQAPSRVRSILNLEPDQRGEFSHHIPKRETLLALRDTWTYDGFLAMLCLARRGEILGNDPAHAFPAMCAYDMFPRIVRKEPHFRFQWRHIAQCLHRIFWNRIYDGGARIDLPIDVLFANVEKIATSSRVHYALKSGKRLSDEQQLKLEITKLKWKRDRLRQEARQKEDERRRYAELYRLFASLK